MRHKNGNSVIGLQRWGGGMLCGCFGVAISIWTLIIEVIQYHFI